MPSQRPQRGGTEPASSGIAGVVTGAGSDTGIAICAELGRRGLGVLCVDHGLDRARRAADACRSAGGLAEAHAADFTSEAQVLGYAERARQLWGDCRFFLNNAGTEGVESSLASYPTAAWDEVFAINLRSAFLGLKAMFPLLSHARPARVVNTASVAGIIATPFLAPYGASKLGLIGLTKTAAIEWAPQVIAVNALCPAPLDGALRRQVDPAFASRSAAPLAPAGQPDSYATPAEVATMAGYLLTESPIHFTGQVISLDGSVSVA